MTATLNSTGVLFNDSTQQNTAFIGGRGQVFTASGTFTIPTGVTAVKVTVVGGGGSSANTGGCTPTAGNSGATSSVLSGTQTISTISATGGAGASPPFVANGGIGSGGDLNIRGAQSSFSASSITFSGTGGAGLYGSGGAKGGVYSGAAGGTAIKWLTGLTPGNTLSVTVGAGGAAPAAAPNGYAGGAGVVIFEW